MERYILALDQGTTSSRALIFDRNGQPRAMAQKEIRQYYPRSGWVEHDPSEIWSSQISVAVEAMSKINISGYQLDGIGITNQRETTLVWDRTTGEPLGNAIVWQDRRTAEYCDRLKSDGLQELIRSKTGLVIDAYFSGPKIRWILDHTPGARERARQGKLAFGTVDTWLMWKLSEGRSHITDVSNAGRTMLFNIQTLEWDEELLKLMDIPVEMMPKVMPSSMIYDYTPNTFFGSDIPLAGIAGDQQAALFGQMCLKEGMVKNTYGTGCFVLMNTGGKPVFSDNNLLTTVAWKIGGQTSYALEGSIFNAGAVLQWLRDGLAIIQTAAEAEALARTVPDNGNLYFVPAFTGMGAPYWDQYARGMMIGQNRGTTRAHIARAALESIAFQTMDVLKVMEKDSGIAISELRADGGASASNLLMQIQADLLGIKVVRPKTIETTALGAAYLAGLATGFWKDIRLIEQQWQDDQTFSPSADPAVIRQMKQRWSDAVRRAGGWERD